MLKIGEFSTLSRTTIKTLRYYEKEGLLLPCYIDSSNGYRFYESKQLIDLAKIISLRQLGISILDIKEYLHTHDSEILQKRKNEIENTLLLTNKELSKINYLLKGYNMKKEVIIKELPDYTVYYKEGKIKNFEDITAFILASGEECQKLNPNIKCIEPDYCYVSYLDNEYREHDFRIRYAQAVTESGVENEEIKFEKLEAVEAACVYHKGSYDSIRETYSFIINWIKENNYEIIEPIRERYIDGIWNKDNVEDWLTEIEVPIKKTCN